MPQRAHQAIVAVAVWEWIALATGAYQTSSRIALNTGQLGTVHAIVGAGALLAGVGVCFRARLPRSALWLTFASLGLSGVTGWMSSNSRGAIVSHSVFSHMAIAVITAAAVRTSSSWSQPAK